MIDTPNWGKVQKLEWVTLRHGLEKKGIANFLQVSCTNNRIEFLKLNGL